MGLLEERRLTSLYRQKLALKLKGGLLGGQQHQRRAFRRVRQHSADFRQATVRFAAAGRAEQKGRLHAGLFNREP